MLTKQRKRCSFTERMCYTCNTLLKKQHSLLHIKKRMPHISTYQITTDLALDQSLFSHNEEKTFFHIKHVLENVPFLPFIDSILSLVFLSMPLECKHNMAHFPNNHLSYYMLVIWIRRIHDGIHIPRIFLYIYLDYGDF